MRELGLGARACRVDRLSQGGTRRSMGPTAPGQGSGAARTPRWKRWRDPRPAPCTTQPGSGETSDEKENFANNRVVKPKRNLMAYIKASSQLPCVSAASKSAEQMRGVSRAIVIEWLAAEYVIRIIVEQLDFRDLGWHAFSMK